MKPLKRILAAVAVSLAVAAPAVAEKWDMPMSYAATTFQSEVGAEFARCVTTGTGGDIEIVTHPSDTLIKRAEIKDAIQEGRVPIGEVLLSAHQYKSPIFGFDSVPFLATSFDDSARLWNAAKPTLAKVLGDQGLTLLYSAPWPPQGFYFRNEVESVADMDGIRFRSYNSTTSRLAELTGMLPVKIELAEANRAFAEGVADSMVSSSSSGNDYRVWENLNYFYEVDAWLPRNYVMVNSGTWSGVSRSNRNVIRGCAELAEYTGFWRSIENTVVALQGLREGGMTVAKPNPAMEAELEEIGKAMTAEWLEVAGPEGKAIIDAFRASQ